MKRYNAIFSMGLLIIFLLVACGGGSATATAPAPAQVATEPQTGGIPTSPDESTLPIDLSGPPPGTPMIWVDGSILVHVPGSVFIMGGEGTDNPIHKVGLSSFWIYRTKVTNRMYTYCVAVGKCAPPKDPDSLKDFNNVTLRDIPVAGVDWEQADIYCKFIQGRLPTEAEWEKTARGMEGNVYPWGDSAPACTLLNFNGDCVGKKTKVFEYPAGKSFYTAMDMAGNAFEWTNDWYNQDYYGISPVADPRGPDAGTVRTVRSSSYQSDQSQVPSYRRFFLDPKTYRPDLGFRCVVENPHPFLPMCSDIFVPGKLGNENLGGQPANPDSCQTPKVSIDEVCSSAKGKVTNGVLDSVEGGNCKPDGNGGFFCSGTGSVKVKVCVQCDNLEYPKGGECGIGQFTNDVTNSCDSQGQPGECPAGYTKDAVNQCCTAGPGISYPGCGPNEGIENNQCGTGESQKPGCDYVTVDLSQNCPVTKTPEPPTICTLTDGYCKQICPYGGSVNADCTGCDCNSG